MLSLPDFGRDLPPLTLFPAVLLLLGAFVLTVWRPPGRARRLVDPAVVLIGLLACLFLAGSVPAASLVEIWPSEFLPGGQLRFALTSTTWPMLVVVLSVVAVSVLIDQRLDRTRSAAHAASCLTFVAASSVVLAAADLLTAVLAWSAAILAEGWFVSESSRAAGEAPRGVSIRGIDLAAVLLLVGASTLPEAHSIRLGLLIAAASARAISSMIYRSRLEQVSEATELVRPVITAISLLAFLSWAVGPGDTSSGLRLLGWIGAAALMLAAVALVIRPADRGSPIAWIAVCGGAALVGAVATPELAPRSFAGAGLLLGYCAVAGLYWMEPPGLRRPAAVLAVVSVAGLPLTSGANSSWQPLPGPGNGGPASLDRSHRSGGGRLAVYRVLTRAVFLEESHRPGRGRGSGLDDRPHVLAVPVRRCIRNRSGRVFRGCPGRNRRGRGRDESPGPGAPGSPLPVSSASAERCPGPARRGCSPSPAVVDPFGAEHLGGRRSRVVVLRHSAGRPPGDPGHDLNSRRDTLGRRGVHPGADLRRRCDAFDLKTRLSGFLARGVCRRGLDSWSFRRSASRAFHGRCRRGLLGDPRNRLRTRRLE